MQRASLLLCLLLTACGDDGLGDKFNPDEGGDEEYGPASPIEPGTKIHYFFEATFNPNTSSGGGGLTENETQRAGHLCLKIDDVRDTESAQYDDASETIVRARVQVDGGYSLDDIYIGIQGTDTPDPDVVDERIGTLWVFQLTFPSRGHGLSSPTAKNFKTRHTPFPGGGFESLPFFEVRSMEDKTWLGWDGFDADLEVSPNFLNVLYDYFGDTFGTQIFLDHDIETTPQAHTACNDGSGASDCYSLTVVWRESSAGLPDEFGAAAASVLHRIRWDWDAAGVLRRMGEYVVPDINPTADVPNDLPDCLPAQPCMHARFDDDGNYETASCEF